MGQSIYLLVNEVIAMTNFKSLNLSDSSLIQLLNTILSMLQEDRKNATEHHDLLATMLATVEGTAGGMGTIELQILLGDLATGLTGFLKNIAQSTDQTIKVAKIMANHLTKIDRNAVLTEDERDQIEDTIKSLTDEKDTLSKQIDFESEN